MKTRLPTALVFLLALGMTSCETIKNRQFDIFTINTEGQPVPCEVVIDGQPAQDPVRNEHQSSLTIDVSFEGKNSVSILVVPSNKSQAGEPEYLKSQPRIVYPVDSRKQLFAVLENPRF